MRGYFKTIAALEDAYYGPEAGGYLRKDEQVTTSITGVRNIIFGSKLWQNIVTTSNTFGILPKIPWEQSGFRAITVAGATGSLGVSEGGALPATTKPSLIEVSITPKDLALSVDISLLQRNLEGKDDTALFADVLTEQAAEFNNRLNRGLNNNVTNLASTNIESIDRAISSYQEVTDCGDITAGDADLYGVDRDAAASWIDAYVVENNNTDRDLQLTYLDTVFQNVRPYWQNYGGSENKVITTGYDTLARLQQLMTSKQIFQGYEKVKGSVNGISTVEGTATGFNAALYQNVPIVPDQNVVQDTISRINLIDLDYMAIGVLQPIVQTESKDHIALNKLADEVLFHAQMELVTRKFGCHGKVRDSK